MSSEFGFDLKTFLEKTCRTCSCYFSRDDSVKFYRIFTEKVAANETTTENAQHVELENSMAVAYEPSDEIKDIYLDLLLWKLNIKPNDGLPQQICTDCMSRFCNVKTFREECLDTQRVLQSYFKDDNNMLETASVGKLSPKAESVQSDGSEAMPNLFAVFNNPLNLKQDMPASPDDTQLVAELPKFEEEGSPKYSESLYGEKLAGTPPPLFEEIKTDIMYVDLLEDMQQVASNAAQTTTAATAVAANQQQEKLVMEEMLPKLAAKKALKNVRTNDDDDDEQSSTPTSDEDEDNDDEVATTSDDNDDMDFETESTYSHSTDRSYISSISRLQCKICNAIFNKRVLLREHHKRAHPQEKPYVCDICSSAFKTNFLLNQHKARHNRPDSVQCDLCHKYFRSQLHLQRHAKNFHLTSNYTCHICHEKFENYTQIRFQYHVRQHGEKRFQCKICEKSFHQKIHLINHMRTHTKEQPFCCHICGKSYRQKSACNEHILTHTDPNPFKCKICYKGFTQSSSLRLHYRTHSDNKPFCCHLCGHSFAQKVHLKKHQLTHTAVKS